MTKEQDAFKLLNAVYGKAVPVVNGLHDHLMKAHEFVLYAGNEVPAIAEQVADKIMEFSENLNAVGEDVYKFLQDLEKAAYPEQTVSSSTHADEPVQDKVKDVSNQPVEGMSRQDKLTEVLRLFGLKDNAYARNSFDAVDDEELSVLIHKLRNPK